MSDIGPGDWVECVRDSRKVPGTFAVGAIYQVKAVLGHDAAGNLGVQIVGKPTEKELIGFPNGWVAHLFRPIYRPKADLIESLKRPALEDA